MGQLSAERVTIGRLFAVSGVDFVRPFQVKCTNHRVYKILKSYVTVFVCFKTRAVHTEIVRDLSSITFIVARKGLTQTLYSNNATHFADSSNVLNFSDVRDFAATERFEQKFIPPRAPHFGGIWESAVKAMKAHLVHSISKSILTVEDFSTSSPSLTTDFFVTEFRQKMPCPYCCHLIFSSILFFMNHQLRNFSIYHLTLVRQNYRESLKRFEKTGAKVTQHVAESQQMADNSFLYRSH